MPLRLYLWEADPNHTALWVVLPLLNGVIQATGSHLAVFWPIG